MLQTLFLLVLSTLSSFCLGAFQDCTSTYDVVWTSLTPESNTASTYYNTMPLGNGVMGSNVWFDANTGSVTHLIGRQDAWDESHRLIKVGYMNYTFTPNIFLAGNGNNFTIRMDVRKGRISYENSKGLKWFTYIHSDLHVGILNITSNPKKAYKIQVSTRPVRTASKTFKPPFDCIDYTVGPDVVEPDGRTIYHRNNPAAQYVLNTLKQENLLGALEAAGDPLTNLTIGMSSWENAAVGLYAFGTHVEQTKSVTEWNQHMYEAVVFGSFPSYSNHVQYWEQYWAKSYICLSGEGFRVGQQYALQRMLQGMQGRARFPIKFNGLMYTAQRSPAEDDRQWGGLNWWQNLRSPYYGMYGSGDFDLIQTSLLESFLKTLPFAKARTQIYYNFSGAFWPEYTSSIGAMHPESYGCNRAGVTNPPYWWDSDVWNHYNWQGSLDLCHFIFDLYDYTQNATVLTAYQDLITSVIDFYRQKYPSGTIYPTQSIETWQCPNYPPDPNVCATDDTPTVTGLRVVIQKALQLQGFLTPQQASTYKAYLQGLAAVPVVSGPSGDMFAPCGKCPPSTSNVENAELYTVHPYRYATYGKGNLTTLAINAFNHKRFTEDDGWCQNAMDAALLGLAPQAKQYVMARANVGADSGYRFQAFSPHLQDYPPSGDHLGVMNSAVQYMLGFPKDDGKNGMWLLPAWPCEWDTEFRIRGPGGITIDGQVQGGKAQYTVTGGSADQVTLVMCQ
eukprot:PhF_6_TR1028/c0_g1_i1/m.2085